MKFDRRTIELILERDADKSGALPISGRFPSTGLIRFVFTDDEYNHYLLV